MSRTAPSSAPPGWLTRLAGSVTANTALVLTALTGGLLVLALTVAGAGVYDAVAEQDGVARLDGRCWTR